MSTSRGSRPQADSEAEDGGDDDLDNTPPMNRLSRRGLVTICGRTVMHGQSHEGEYEWLEPRTARGIYRCYRQRISQARCAARVSVVLRMVHVDTESRFALERSVLGPCQAQVLSQLCALVLSSESSAGLQFGDDMFDEVLDPLRQGRWHKVEAIRAAGVEP